MLAPKSYQIMRPGLKKPKPKKKKLASGGALSARSGSTGSLPAYPSPRQASSRQRSLTADQPRLRRAQLDSRVRESAPGRPSRRLAPPTTQHLKQLQLGDRLPSLRARIAEMKALASFFPDSELSVSDATGSDTRTNIASILKLRDYEQKAAKTRRKPIKPAGAAAVGSQRSRRLEPPVRGRRMVSGPARPSQTGSPQSRRPGPAVGSTASSSEHRDRPTPGGGDQGRTEYYSDERGHRDHRDQRDHQAYRGRQVRRGEDRDRPECHSDERDPPGYRSDDREWPGHQEARDRSGHRSQERDASGQRRAEPERAAPRREERDRAGSVRSEPQPSGARSDALETASAPPIDPLKLLAPLQIPNLNDLVAGSGGGSPRNLQDVIKDFLLAKQQASATASVMSNLRSLMEVGPGQAASEAGQPVSQPAAVTSGAVHQSVPVRSASSDLAQTTGGGGSGGWQGDPAAAGGAGATLAEERPNTASSAASLASSAGTTYLLPGDSKSQLASSSKQLAGRGPHEGGSEVGSALRSVSEAGLQSGGLQSVHSGPLQSVQSGGLQSVQSGGLPSTQSGPIPSSRSGTLQSGQSGLQSGQDVAKQLTASREQMEVNQLRTQYQLQQAKLKQIEQKNYVLSLAVEGQEKTIRTMTNELQDAREATRESRQPAADPARPPLQATLSAQSWPIESSKAEFAVGDDRTELDRLNHLLESKEHELNILKACRPATEIKSFSAGKPRTSQNVTNSHHLDQAGLCEDWRPRLDGARTRSTELYRAAAAAAEPGHYPPGPLRRHSFTVPPPRSDDAWLGPVGPCQSRIAPAAASCHSTPLQAGSGRPLPFVGMEEPLAAPCIAHCTAGYAGRQDELRQTVQESLSRVRQLETELAELRCSRDRDRDRDRDRGDHGSQIVRMTEVKLQQTYHSLVAEQNKNKLLNKALHEANTRLEQQASQAERLKERLTSSVEERRQLQTRLSATESASTAANNKQQQLSDDLQRKTQLLAQASQYLDERIDQVAALSRELDVTRAEAAHEARLAAERLAQLRTRAAELETLTAKQEAENRLLRQASAETDQLSQTGRRLRQRVLELTDKLERSTATGKMLENYVLFLKASYSKMFGTAVPAPAPSPGLDIPASLRDLLQQAETQ